MYKKNVNKRMVTPIADFNPVGDDFQTLGSKILSAVQYGSDLVNSIPVTFDDEDSEDVDILSSPNHDFFDIAEVTGEMIEASNVPTDTQKE